MTGIAEFPKAYSLYWRNVDPAITAAQAKVFSHLGIPLIQDLRDGMAHGEWMDELMSRSGDDTVVICDIDAIPLSTKAYALMTSRADEGSISGLAQTCNHLGHADHIYPAPMFVAVRRSVWRAIGSPSMAPTSEYDAGQKMALIAEEKGVPIKMLLPNSCLKSVWPLAGKRIYGIGTFYGDNEFFHLFQSRKNRYVKVFLEICGDVCADRPVDFRKYMSIIYPKSRLPKFMRKYFANP